MANQYFTVHVDGVSVIDAHGRLMLCTGMMESGDAVRTILRAGADANPGTLIELRCESHPPENAMTAINPTATGI